MLKCNFSNIYPRQRLYGKFFMKEFFKQIILGNILKSDDVIHYERKMSNHFHSNEIKLLNHERIGIYVILKKLVKESKKREVIMSPFTIWDMVNMVIMAGCKPVFADIDINNFSLNFKSVNKNINRNTLCVIYTHYLFKSPTFNKLKLNLKKKKIYLIEDCAIFNGSEHLKNNKIHKYEFRLLSFGRSKFVSTFSAGAILVSKENTEMTQYLKKFNFKKPSIFWLLNYFFKTVKLIVLSNVFLFRFIFIWLIKFLTMFDFDKFKNVSDNDPNPTLHKILPKGYVSKITNFQAKSIFLKYDKKVNKNKKDRIKRAKIYKKHLSDCDGVTLPKFKNSDDLVFTNFPIILNNRDDLYKILLNNNYDCSIHFYKNCNKIDIFKKFHCNLKNLDKIYNKILVLPTYPDYPIKNIINICKLIKNFSKKSY